jgi:hypothetical protein
MANWYIGREAVKLALGIEGSARNRVIDSHIEAASREVDNLTHRHFIPLTETRNYPWPTKDGRATWWIPLDEDLLSVDTNGLTKEGDDVTVIATADFFLEPQGLGPPYHRIEIDLSSTSFFSSKDTHQRQIRVTGSWAYGNDTKAAGALAEADDGSETELEVTDASLVDVGDTILIGSEQMFVSERAVLDTATNTNGALAKNKAGTTVPVGDGTKVKAGEVILVEAERMFVESISSNDLTVIRAYDGSTLAAHDTAKDVYTYRTLTVTRGENGTTAATHDNADPIVKYVPPADIVALCKALAIGNYEAEKGGWTGSVGSGEGTVRVSQSGLNKLRDRVQRQYRRFVIGAV